MDSDKVLGADCTVTVTVALADPLRLVAVNVYGLVDAGVTVTGRAEIATPFNASVAEPVTVPLKTVDWPAVIVLGVAIKLDMVGGATLGFECFILVIDASRAVL